MKKQMFKTVMLAILMAVIIPMSILAQHKSVQVIVHKDDSDSTESNSFYSTIFDVEDVEKMHKKLDSIFSTLDKTLDKKIKVMAFNADSMFNRFDFNHSFDFNGNIDSILSMHKLSTNDKRIEELIKSHNRMPDKQVWVFDNEDSAHHKNMNIEIITDSIMENGKTVIKKEIIIKSDKDEEPIVIQRFKNRDSFDDDKIIAYKNKIVKRRPGERIVVERGDKSFKLRDSAVGQKVVEEIPLSDAEILIKGGVSSKVITSEALKPQNVEVKIKVKEEFGNKTKTVGISMSFNDAKDLQIKILDKDGHILFEETKKKFTGTYTKDIEMNEALSPYYFLVIRDKKMFGRILKD